MEFEGKSKVSIAEGQDPLSSTSHVSQVNVDCLQGLSHLLPNYAKEMLGHERQEEGFKGLARGESGGSTRL